jgi:ribosome maturation factor RimP
VGSGPPFLLLERMRLNDATTVRLWNIAEPVCAGAGYELIDLALTQSPGGWVLRVFIDHRSQPGAQPGVQPGADPGAETDHVVGAEGGLDAHDPGSSVRISFADCERVSRELSAVLDVEDPIAHAYSLEVSSPGLDRPLRTVAHFERVVGEIVKVTLASGIGGRRNFKGTLVAVNREPGGEAGATSEHDQTTSEQAGQVMMTIHVDGTEYRLPFNDIESARLVPDWDALFPRGQQR